MSPLAITLLAAFAGGLVGLSLFVIDNWIVEELEFEGDIDAETGISPPMFPTFHEASELVQANPGWAAAFVLCSGTSSAIVTHHYDAGLSALCSAIFCFALISLIFIDRRALILPDVVTLPTLWLGLGMQLVPSLATLGAEGALMGCILAYAIPAVPSFLYELVRNRRMLGGGDLKMLAMIGVWMGPIAAFFILFASAILLVLVQSLRGKVLNHMHDEYSFGPYLGGISLVYYLLPLLS